MSSLKPAIKHVIQPSLFIRGSVLVLGALLILTIPNVALAQTVTTHITSSGLGTHVSTSGTTTTITGGTRPGHGGNLFHSFGSFSVGAPDTANFSNETGLPTTNILSRVTGGEVSNIFGTLKTTNFGNAALWLINPAGIVFGPTASLNVGGAMHVSTADYLRLGTDGLFYADLSKNSTLSVAPVEAFGFLGINPVGAITVEGGTVENSQQLSIVGRDLSDGTSGITVTGVLSNPSGRISLASAGLPQNPIVGGELQVVGLLPVSSYGFANLGTVKIIGGGGIVTSGEPGGKVYIRGGNLVVEGSPLKPAVIQTSTRGALDHDGTGIDVEVTGEVRLITNASPGVELASSSFGTGNGGNIRIAADSIHLTGTPNGGNAGIVTRAFSEVGGAGNAGTIDLHAKKITLEDNSRIQVTTFGPGSGGMIQIKTEQLVLQDLRSTNPGIQSTFISAGSNGEGNAGSVNVMAEKISLRGDVGIGSSVKSFSPTDRGTFQGNPSAGITKIKTGSLELYDGAQVSAGTSRGAGDGGAIHMKADSIIIDGKKPEGFVSGIFTTSEATPGNPPPTGKGGDIVVASKTIELRNQGEINASTFRGGPAGNIIIKTNLLKLDNGRIASEGSTTSSNAASGNITINSNDIRLVNGASLTVGSFKNLPRFNQYNSDITPQGDAGMIALTAKQITLDGTGTTISARTEGAGNGGAIDLNVDIFSITRGSEISTSSVGKDATAGDAGGIAMYVAGLFRSQGGTVSSTAERGAGGNVLITAGDLRLANGTTISAKSAGSKNAGSITLISSSDLFMQDSSVTTLAEQAAGGNIKLTADTRIQLIDSEVTSRVQKGSGSAGSINLDPDFIALKNSRVLSTAEFGPGGDIRFTANSAILIDPFSILDAQSQFGGSGTINLQAPTKFLSGTIAPLPGAIVEVAGLYSAKCAGQKGGEFSSFTVPGRDRIPLEPGELLPTPILLAEGQDGLAPTSKLRALSMATRLQLPEFERSLGREALWTLFDGGCHS